MGTLTKDEACLIDEISALLVIASINNRREEITQIKHIHQQDTWDCGEPSFIVLQTTIPAPLLCAQSYLHFNLCECRPNLHTNDTTASK